MPPTRYLITAVAAFALALAACGGDDDPPETSPTGAATANGSPGAGVPTAWAFDETGEFEGSLYTLHDFQDPAIPTALTLRPRDGNRWVALDIEQKAVAEGDWANSLYFLLESGDGETFDEIAFAAKDPSFVSRQLKAGEVYRGWLVFEVPEDAEIASVIVLGDDDETFLIADLED